MRATTCMCGKGKVSFPYAIHTRPSTYEHTHVGVRVRVYIHVLPHRVYRCCHCICMYLNVHFFLDVYVDIYTYLHVYPLAFFFVLMRIDRECARVRGGMLPRKMEPETPHATLCLLSVYVPLTRKAVPKRPNVLQSMSNEWHDPAHKRQRSARGSCPRLPLSSPEVKGELHCH